MLCCLLSDAAPPGIDRFSSDAARGRLAARGVHKDVPRCNTCGHRGRIQKIRQTASTSASHILHRIACIIASSIFRSASRCRAFTTSALRMFPSLIAASSSRIGGRRECREAVAVGTQVEQRGIVEFGAVFSSVQISR